MDVAAAFHRLYKNISERNWSDVLSEDTVAPDVRFRVPAYGIDATTWDEGIAALRPAVEAVDGRYEVEDVVEHGPLAVAFITCTGTLDGRPATWSACSVSRIDNGKVVESWTLRGSDPVPVGDG
jgi:hypothetical protein